MTHTITQHLLLRRLLLRRLPSHHSLSYRIASFCGFACLYLAAFCSLAAAQTPAPPAPAPPSSQRPAAAQASNRLIAEDESTIDETFDINISEQRIVETDFARSTAVRIALDAVSPVSLEVGVAARAKRIDVLLRGITGRVRFRASLQSVRRVLDAHPPR